MSISKFLKIMILSSSSLACTVLTGCAPEAPTQSEVRQQPIMPWTVQNSSQAFGGQIDSTQIRGIFYSTTPPTGTAPSPTNYFLRSQNTDYYAPINSITYNGLQVVSVTTSDGWLQVTAGGATYTPSGTFSLIFQLGGPAAGTLRITGTQGDPDLSYGQYVVEYAATSSDVWSPYCPHPYQDSDGNSVNLTEYMIPVGGATWLLDGRRIDDASSIQLSCSHDSIGGCVTWGYAPWATQGSVSLKDTHQACTRMKRADFCGTGDPLTTLNQSAYLHTQIQIWDSVSINPMQPQTTSTMEALWSPSGATCFNRPKYRTTLQNYVGHMQALVTSKACPQIPTCSKGSTGLVGSARPCTAIDPATGNCTSN